ncbi:TPA: ABC transporter ATP-binding protein [Aeromonas dhakensis]|uniref:ABC transporter ATP-binding protein n=1 Tax=Aeromonas dhakensis TaxID=196024 RepID=UPI00035C2E31|nr:ABC transporter ATP-binding protein [Aeromonas dhakensis]MBF8449238.1 ABC transporter ATP-binding protein [Aeromonas dhakensis]MBL0524401.1 ABC transporter ATP-binding protein [Aeromonas dhakensis]MDX7695542.1 ABC transporter ATP-binding protein [Aeromonas dhakensis]QSR43931.1 ABC transporter ATP-binding protein [Aeromonas dhakensis]RQM88369.1 ABC transporter ATP-binding protein [Aeromonas dhakensis]
MITLDNVTKYYPTKFGRHYVLKDVSFTLPGDRNIGILGANGAGKSTLLRLLGGMDMPNKGKVTRHSRVSWPLALSGGFQGSMTGRENTRFVCRIHGVHDTAAVEEWVKEFSEIGKHFELPIKGYSSGMKSKFSFAVSMAFDFDIYLTDEITSVGDARFKQKCIDVFTQKRQTASLIMVSHDMNTLRQQCDMGIVLQNGQLTLHDDIEDAITIYKKL